MNRGDCYDANGKYFLYNNLGPDWKIVHASVLGQGSIAGIRHGHCFLENDNTVLDFSNGRKIVMNKKQYYKIGKIKHARKYNKMQFNEKLLKYKTWGPYHR